MRKIAAIVMSLFLLAGVFPTNGVTLAATKAPRILDVQTDTILMDDGTVWLKRQWAATGYMKATVGAVSIYSPERFHSLMNDYALTTKGELISWNNGNLPTVDKQRSGIKHLTGGFYLKSDGTVWSYDGGQVKDLKNIVLIESGFLHYAYLTTSGEIYHSYLREAVVDKVADPSSIVSLRVGKDNDIAYLDKSGKVVVVDIDNFDFNNGKVTFQPRVVTTDAVHIEYDEDDSLVVTRKDGTVWITGSYRDKDKLVAQVEGIRNAVKAVPYFGTLHETKSPSSNGTIIAPLNPATPKLVLHRDGSWKIYNGNRITTIQPPEVSGITLTASNTKPAVGNTIELKVVQSYNNGYKETLSSKDFSLTIDKPYLLKAADNGSYKVAGVGEARATVTAGDRSQSVTITASLGKNLTGATNANNVTYLPIQSVFQSLGGAVVYTSASKTYDITVGNTTIQLKVGQKNAKVNGKEVAMDQVVKEEKGIALFPSSLLSKALGAKLQWDAKLKQMLVSFGAASMIIESADTPKVKKQEAQGTLVKYLNKPFWVNRYKNWERFVKLTVTDIEPVGENSFQVVFKDVKGNKLLSDTMSRDFVSLVLDDPHTFLPYDPFKKYNWSAATWNAIKASKVAIGMNKTQVELSWGQPNDVSKLASKELTVEVWRYGFQYIAFTNDKVTQIYTY